MLFIFGKAVQIKPVSDMTPLPTQDSSPAESPPLSRAVILAVAMASLVIGAFAITSQSYDADEAVSLIVAMVPSVDLAWHYAQAVGTPVLQAPLYHAGLFVWNKMAGGSEWAMRAANIPWFILAQLSFLILLRHRPQLALTACLLAIVNPALWLYLDATRPYIMQYAAACWLVTILLRGTLAPAPPSFSRENHIALWGACVAIVLLFGTGWSSMVWVGGFILALAWLRLTATPTSDTQPLPRVVAALLPLLLILLLAYQLLVWPGWPTGNAGLKQFAQGIIYIVYEFFGFSGFGPGRLDLRLSPLRSIMRHLPMLLPLTICLGVMAVFAIRQAMRHEIRRYFTTWMLGLVLPAAVLLGACLVFNQRPTPRDFIPVLPVIILGLALTILAAVEKKSLLLRGIAVAIPVLWLVSGLNLRWQQGHAKDDYRAAAAIAAASLREDKEVWWVADGAAAFIYFTPVSLTESPGRAWAMQSPAWDNIRFKLPPRIIIVSRPDIFDVQGAVARYASENHFVPALRLHGLTIMKRESDSLPRLTP